eukprot:jgi/Botrbrau1/4278/Bobra.0390s0018.1
MITQHSRETTRAGLRSSIQKGKLRRQYALIFTLPVLLLALVQGKGQVLMQSFVHVDKLQELSVYLCHFLQDNSRKRCIVPSLVTMHTGFKCLHPHSSLDSNLKLISS